MMRRMNFQNTANTRDLGGYPTLSGQYTCYNRFWRSDAPLSLSSDEVEVFGRCGITTVADLRSDEEVAHKPSFFESAPGFEYHRFPLSGALPATEEDIPRIYLELIHTTSSMLPLMKLFASASTGILFHCTAGKDRTGVVAALLLDLVGAPRADIVADYQVTGTYLQHIMRRLHEVYPTLPAWAGQSKPDYLFTFFDLFDAMYPSVTAFFASMGLEEQQILSIQNKLVTP